MTSRATIRYLSAGEIVEIKDIDPMRTLLDHLRLDRAKTGTKEGCNEGDCGACTVALGRLVDGKVVYQPVNACIQLVGQVDGAEIVTVEDLASPDGALHPVQAAMVDYHGSQCGFCTPGIVMSLFALYQADGPVERADVTDQLAGNLCRCTGYRPIVDAAIAACGSRTDHAPADQFALHATETSAKLADLADDADVFVGTDAQFFAAPASIVSLAALYEAHPDATIVAGATDVGLWITKQLRTLPKIIHLGRVKGLADITNTADSVTMGATATFAAVESAMAGIDPDLGEVWRRIGSKQVRASGTVGGNIANGSPIGDSPPALIALDATLTLQKGAATRTLPLEAFFNAYGKQDRRASEFVRSVSVPKLKPDQVFRAYKISKRFDQDISAIMSAVRLTLDGDFIREARIAYGGMAATPKRASGAEKALVGASLADPGSWQMALKAIGTDFTPLSDMRASASYRIEMAAAVLEKALIELSGETSERTRVVGIRPALHAAE
jgi:xanthine dehydrogenase small subunit